MEKQKVKSKFGIVIHGGCGNIPLIQPAEYEEQIKKALETSLNSGYSALSDSKSALEAVEAAIKVLEDNIFFNAGKGSCINLEGDIEMDAGIMEGSTLKSGSVASVKLIKNPIVAAVKVQKSKHNLLCAEGAEQFAKEQGCIFEKKNYFFGSEDEKKQMQQQINWMNSVAKQIFDNKKQNQISSSSDSKQQENNHKYGTVGAVALDKFGNLAAATSTGGLMKKMKGRIGDSSIVGLGNYANKLCAISATGIGEKIMNSVLAYDIAAYMQYKQTSLEEAANYIIFEKFKEQHGQDGQAGIIAIDASGNFCFAFNTLGMNRGVKMSDGKFDILIH